MKLTSLFRLFVLINLIGLTLGVWTNMHSENLQDKQASLVKAKELQIGQLQLLQSEFDALQMLVASYVVTSDSRFLNDYYELLDLQGGKRVYSSTVDSTYWSAMIAKAVPRVELLPGEGLSLEDRLQSMPIKVNQADLQILTDKNIKLRRREQIIFALTQGLYDPLNQEFVSDAQPRQDLAIQMLFSTEHLELTHEIDAVIRNQIAKLDNDYKRQIASLDDQISHSILLALLAILGMTVALALGTLLLRRFVVEPLKQLDRFSRSVEQGEFDTPVPQPRLITEMLSLARGIQLMMGAFSRELEQRDARRKAELEVLAARLAEKEAQAQAEARGALLANMSHEIRTPMNAIIGMTALAVKGDIPPREKDFLGKALSAAKSLLDLLNDILDYSKGEAGMLELEEVTFRLDEVLANAWLSVESQAARKGLLLLNEYEGEEAPFLMNSLKGDPVRLRQIYINLLTNAVKFTNEGHVKVVSKIERVGRTLVLTSRIEDSGEGMTTEQRSRLFKKFMQADRSVSRQHGGTGLGLSICKQLCEAMGGHIAVNSVRGQGSTFEFTVVMGSSGESSKPVVPGRLLGRSLVLGDHDLASGSLLSLLQCLPQADAEQLSMAALGEIDLSDYARVFVVHPKALNRNPRQRKQLLQAVESSHCEWILVEDSLPIGEDSQEVRHWLLDQQDHQFRLLNHPLLFSDLVGNKAPGNLIDSRLSLGARLRVDEARKLLAGYRALVLEDHPVNREVIFEQLNEAGLEVEIQPDGAQGWARLSRSDKSFDIVITDLEMPFVDGIQFTRMARAREEYDALPILGLTGHAFEEVRIRCLKEGMNGVLTKPVEAEQLYRMLVELLGGKRSESADPTQSKVEPVASEPPAPTENRRVRLAQIFLQNCADLPERLHALADSKDQSGFKRELHSMISVMAILEQKALSAQFREWNTRLQKDQSTDLQPILGQIGSLWPGLLDQYRQQINEDSQPG